MQTSSERGDEVGLVGAPEHPSTSRPTGSAEWSQYHSTSAQVSYSATSAGPSGCLDQAHERLARQVELADRRLELPHHRPRRLAVVAGVDLPLELVERGQPVALGLVAEDVHEPREAVDGPQVRAQRAREEKRRDREVLRPRTGGDGGWIHAPIQTTSGRIGP